MAIADLRADADAYFATSIKSPKTAEIQNFPEVLLSFQRLIDKLWSEEWRVWFPGGKDDPDLVLIKVDAREGEFWDNSGANGLSYVFEGLKAVIKGEKLQNDKGGAHAKIRLVSG